MADRDRAQGTQAGGEQCPGPTRLKAILPIGVGVIMLGAVWYPALLDIQLSLGSGHQGLPLHSIFVSTIMSAFPALFIYIGVCILRHEAKRSPAKPAGNADGSSNRRDGSAPASKSEGDASEKE